MSIGGKWDRKEKAHLFNKSIEDVLDEILLTGEYTDSKKEYQFFETPDELAKEIVFIANIKEGESVLEPSAGKGRIAKLIKGCDCIELNDENYSHLLNNGFNVVGRDFLTSKKKYDVIVANPPFSKQQDIDHINHMLDLAFRVVSVASASILFRNNKKTVDFRQRIADLNGTIISLPEKSFSIEGTNVNTCLISVL